MKGKKHIVNKRVLQVVLAIIAVIAVVTGFVGIIIPVSHEYYEVSASGDVPGNVTLDSNLRYFTGLWLGLGLILIWIIPTIEQQAVVLRLVSLMIFLGAIGRMISLISFGVPSTPFIVFMVIELLFPVLIIWQNILRKNSA